MTPAGPAGRPRRLGGWRAAGAVAALVSLAVAVAAAVWLVHERQVQARLQAERQSEQRASIARGRALFHGEAELPARLAGHAQALPVQASRCLNCHQGPEAVPPLASRPLASTGASAVPAAATPPTAPATPLALSPAAASSTASGVLAAGPIGPALNRAQLAELRSRRHAPASRFDAASLCRALQTGIDPAQVMLPGSMPRYTASPSQCDDLWAYLVSS